jgi:hypothetical protein
MSSGVQKTYRGAFTGTGALITVGVLGCRPGTVKLFNRGGLAKAEWNDAMPDASMMKQVTDGTISFPTSGGVTPTSAGFTVGTDADMNVSGELVYWEATEG